MKRVTLVQLTDSSVVAEFSEHDQVNNSTIRRSGLVRAFDEEFDDVLEQFFDEENTLT